jgi:hypothetical protein
MSAQTNTDHVSPVVLFRALESSSGISDTEHGLIHRPYRERIGRI